MDRHVIIDWLQSLEYTNSFDRQGSHASSEYKEHMVKLEDYLPLWLISELAEDIKEKYV